MTTTHNIERAINGKILITFSSVNGLFINGSYFSFSFILPKNEAVTIFWLHWHSTIQFGLEQLYGFCDKKTKQIKINLSCRLSKPILKTLTQTLAHTAENM